MHITRGVRAHPDDETACCSARLIIRVRIAHERRTLWWDSEPFACFGNKFRLWFPLAHVVARKHGIEVIGELEMSQDLVHVRPRRIRDQADLQAVLLTRTTHDRVRTGYQLDQPHQLELLVDHEPRGILAELQCRKVVAQVRAPASRSERLPAYLLLPESTQHSREGLVPALKGVDQHAVEVKEDRFNVSLGHSLKTALGSE